MSNHETNNMAMGCAALESEDFRLAEHFFLCARRSGSGEEADLWLAQVYGRERRFRKARHLLEGLLGSSDEEVRVAARVQLGRLYFDSGHRAEALSCFKELYGAGLRETVLPLAILHIQGKDYDQAEKYAREAISLGLPDAEEMLGDVLVCQKNWAGAVAQYQHVYSSNHRVASKLGISLANQERHEEAIQYLREGISLGDFGPLRNLVAVYLYLGNHRNAIYFGELGIRHGLKGLHELVGNSYLKLDDFRHALEHFKLALREHEASAHLHCSLGRCHYELGDYQEALSCLRQATRKREDGAWFVSGMVYKALQDYGRARRCFTRSTEREDDFSARASYELGELCLRQHRRNSAEMYYQDSWLGGYLPAAVCLCRLAQERHDPEQALRWGLQLVEMGQVGACCLVGQVYLAMGQYDKSREMLLRAQEAGVPEASLGLAMLCAQEGNEEDADRLFEESIEHKVPHALAHYGEALLARKDYAGAACYLTAAWEREHDKEVLVPLAYAYSHAQLADAEAQSMRYLFLAEKEGCLKGRYSKQLKQKLSELLGKRHPQE